MLLNRKDLAKSANAPKLTGEGAAEPRGPDAQPPACVCTSCKTRRAQGDGLCGGCRLKQLAVKRRKYLPLDPQLAEELRLAYRGSNVRELAANLNRISAHTGLPKSHLKQQARRRGFRSQIDRHPWTALDLDFLRQSLGKISKEQIARRLKRSVACVCCRAQKLEIPRPLLASYSISDLVRVFGLSHTRIEGWAERGLLGEVDGRGGHGGKLFFQEAAVVRFVRENPQAFDLGRVDPEWFHELMFGHMASDEEEEEYYTCP